MCVLDIDLLCLFSVYMVVRNRSVSPAEYLLLSNVFVVGSGAFIGCFGVVASHLAQAKWAFLSKHTSAALEEIARLAKRQAMLTQDRMSYKTRLKELQFNMVGRSSTVGVVILKPLPVITYSPLVVICVP